MKFLILALGMLLSFEAQSQEIEPPKREKSFFFYWGYNRGVYASSDIKYKGPGYEFMVYDVTAHDMPEPFDPKVYFNLTKLTIPQFNIRAGYHWKNNIYFTFGWDHMKYQSTNGQTVIMNGHVDSTYSKKYAGLYDNREVQMTHRDFLKMEHSDGFNLIKVNIEKHYELLATKKKRLALTAVVATGPIFPFTWTNATLLGKHNDDRPRFSGLGISATAGAKVTFFDRVFFQFNLDAGYVNAWAITPRPKGAPDRASQKIKYFQKMGVVGFTFNFKRRTKM